MDKLSTKSQKTFTKNSNGCGTIGALFFHQESDGLMKNFPQIAEKTFVTNIKIAKKIKKKLTHVLYQNIV